MQSRIIEGQFQFVRRALAALRGVGSGIEPWSRRNVRNVDAAAYEAAQTCSVHVDQKTVISSPHIIVRIEIERWVFRIFVCGPRLDTTQVETNDSEVDRLKWRRAINDVHNSSGLVRRRISLHKVPAKV